MSELGMNHFISGKELAKSLDDLNEENVYLKLNSLKPSSKEAMLVEVFANCAEEYKNGHTELMESLYGALMESLQPQREEQFELLVEKIANSNTLRSEFFKKQALLHGNRFQQCIEENPLLTPKEFLSKLGCISRNPSRDVATFVTKGLAFSVKFGKRTLYPAFQIDVENQEIYPDLQDVLGLLDYLDDKSVYYWFCTNSDRLNAAPVKLLGDDDYLDDLLSYASETRHRALD